MRVSVSLFNISETFFKHSVNNHFVGKFLTHEGERVEEIYQVCEKGHSLL